MEQRQPGPYSDHGSRPGDGSPYGGDQRPTLSESGMLVGSLREAMRKRALTVGATKVATRRTSYDSIRAALRVLRGKRFRTERVRLKKRLGWHGRWSAEAEESVPKYGSLRAFIWSA